MRINYVIILVSDMKRSVAFYRDVLGIPLRFESPGWTELGTDGATLVLHPEKPGSGDTASRRDGAGTCRPGLAVPNLAEFHQRMADHGVVCLQSPTEVFGARVAQYADPDGLAISVGEERRGRGP